MKYEIVNRKDGTRLSHTPKGQIMGSTLFASEKEATDWMKLRGVSEAEYQVRELPQ